MQGQKSERNKTIDISLEDGKEYLDRCLDFSACINKNLSLDEIKNQIIVGNSLEVSKAVPSACADLIIADPPYNIQKEFHGYTFHQMDYDSYESYTEEWVSAVSHILKPEGSFYVCCDWKSSGAIERVLSKHFVVQNRITWQREKGRGAKKNWKNGMEDIWFCTQKEDNYTFNIEDVMQRRKVIAPYKQEGKPKDWEETEEGNFRNTYPSNFWDDISIPYWSMSENTAHPTQKSEKLLAKLILASSNKGDLVFDPFSGSGSTAVTAFKLDRNFFAIEMNPQYCVWAQKRLEDAIRDKTIQGYADGVFWERNTNSLQRAFKR